MNNATQAPAQSESRLKSLSAALALRATEPHTYRALAATVFRGVPTPVILDALDLARAMRVPPLGGFLWAIEVKPGSWQLSFGISFYRLMAARSGQWMGIEWKEAETRATIGRSSLPEWIECVALRRVGAAITRFPQRAYANECARTKSDGTLVKMWTEAPMKMLRIRAEALALRTAFPEIVDREQSMAPPAVIDPETGEMIKQAPKHLTDPDIAAGLGRLSDADVADNDIPF